MKKSPFLHFPSAHLTGLIIPLFIIYFWFVSCNKNETASTTGNNSHKNISSQIIQQRNLNRERYLFMDFWDRMNEDEYRFIVDSLVQNETLYKRFDSVFCKMSFFSDNNTINDLEFQIVPSFNNNRLFQITLLSEDKDDYLLSPLPLINAYTKKYGTPINNPKASEKINNQGKFVYYVFDSKEIQIEIEVVYTQLIWPRLTAKIIDFSYMIKTFIIKYSNKSTIRMIEDEIRINEMNEKNKLQEEIKIKADKSYDNI